MDKYNPEQFEIVGGSMFDDTPCRADKDYTSLGFKFFKADGVTISGSGALRDKMSPKVVKRGRSDFSVSPDGVQLSAVYQRIFIRKGGSKAMKVQNENQHYLPKYRLKNSLEKTEIFCI